MAELAQIRTGFVGLTTARSPEATPPGGLLEAENVVIRKQNVIESRPGFALGGATDDIALGRVEYPVEGNAAGLVIQDSGVTAYDGFSGETADIKDEAGNDLAWESYAGQVARRSLYLLTSDALRAVYGVGEAVAYRAGAPVPYISAVAALTVADEPAVPSGQYRAYRVVCRRTYMLGDTQRIIRSAPSSRHVLHPLGADQDIRVYILLHEHDDWREGDVLELYGSETGTTYPTDELYLVGEATVPDPSTFAANLFRVVIDDRTPNAQLGMDLYTNESREGAESANYRPPAAGAIGLFNNSLWLGDLTYPASLEISFRSSLDETAAVADDAIGRYTIGGTRTNGSADVTAVSGADIADVKVGMFVTTGAWTVAGGEAPRVISVGADSFTVNGTSNSTATGAITLEDGIRIGSYYCPARWIPQYTRNGDVVAGAGSYVAHVASTLYTAESGTDEWSDISNQPAGSYPRTIYISALLSSTAPPQVWATNGDRYSPALPEPTEATGYQMPQDVLPDNVAWSKMNEPDHFPLDQIDNAGGGGGRVLTLGPTRGAILIGTSHGMWRGYGYADSGVTFSELDKDVRPLGRRCMDGVGYDQFVVADHGVFQCTEDQCKNITDEVLADLDETIFAAAKEGVHSFKIVGNPKDDEVLVCTPAVDDLDGPHVAHYVFNRATSAWTKWVLPGEANDLTIKGPSRRLVAANATAPSAWLEKEADSATRLADGDPSTVSTATVATVTGTAVTINASAWTPAVGDMIDSFLITEVASATAFTVHTTGLTTGAKTFYRGIPCTITPSVNTAKTPHFMKVWAEGAIHWARRAGVYAYTLAFRSAITGLNTATTQSRLLATAPGANSSLLSAPAASRFLVPPQAARGTHLTYSVVIRQALSNWAIEGLSVRVRTTADKAPARLP